MKIMQSKEHDGSRLGWNAIALVGIFALVAGVVLWIIFASNQGSAAEAGDAMGGWNALLSGVAIVFAGGALWMQSEQMRLTHREFRESVASQKQMAEGSTIDRLANQLKAIDDLLARLPTERRISNAYFDARINKTREGESVALEVLDQIKTLLIGERRAVLVRMAFYGSKASNEEYEEKIADLFDLMGEYGEDDMHVY